MEQIAEIPLKRKSKIGRPKKRLSSDLIQALANAQLTDFEIAAIAKCSLDTLHRRFRARLKQWRVEGVASVRRQLFLTAMRKGPGSVAAMIFFLKNFGGMADVVREHHEIEFGRLPMFQAQQPQLPHPVVIEAQKELPAAKEAIEADIQGGKPN